MRTTLPITSLDRLEAPEPLTVHGQDEISGVIPRMRDHGREAVLVIDDAGLLIGILTERDLVRAAAESSGSEWQQDPASRWMQADPASLHATDSIANVIHRMNADRYSRLPVVDAGGRPVGLVTVRDLLTYIVESFPAEFTNLPPGPEHEATRRWGG